MARRKVPLLLLPQCYRDRADHEEWVDLRFEVFAFRSFDELSAGDAFGKFIVDFVSQLASKDLDRGLDDVRVFAGVMIGVGDLEVE
jgi:hypothetical protein